MENLRRLLRTLSRNQLLLVIADRYKKITKAVSKSSTTALYEASLFLDNGLVPYGFLEYVLTYNETQFISKFFESPGHF